MMVVTHEMGFARRVADRVVFMDYGQIVEVQTAGGVLRRARSRSAPRTSCPRSCRTEPTPRRMCMRRVTREWSMALALLAVSAGAGGGATEGGTLEKIGQSGTLTIGTRTGSPPFAYVNAKNEWVGFSIDLVEELVKPALEKKLGKPIKVEKKESTPPTRIPLLSLERGGPDRGDDDRHAHAARERGLLHHLLRDRRPVPGQEGEPHQGHQEHRRPAHRRPAGLDQRPDHPGEGAQGPAARVPGPARGLPGAAPGPGGRLHQRRHPARRPQGQGAESRPSGRSSATSSPTSPTAWPCGRATRTSATSSTAA